MPGGVMAPIPNPPRTGARGGGSRMDDTQTWADRRSEGARRHRRHDVLQPGHRLAAAPHAAPHHRRLPPAAKVAAAPKAAQSNLHKAAALKPALGQAKPDAKADRTRRLDALQLALGDALSQGATLTPPQGASGGQAALVLSGGFTDAVRKAAVEQGLTAPDAPITATAGLSADAYSSQSPLTQAQPLKAGQATGFYWTLTPRAGANEPIKANVCVIVASGPELICGGAVQPAAPANDNNGRIFGVALLLLIAGVVIGWFVRGRSPPATKTAAKPRSKAPGW